MWKLILKPEFPWPRSQIAYNKAQPSLFAIFLANLHIAHNFHKARLNIIIAQLYFRILTSYYVKCVYFNSHQLSSNILFSVLIFILANASD